jgi:glycosyltransferase involved in cell wall biosynthesis
MSTPRTVLFAMHDSAPGGAGVAALRAAAHLPAHGWRPAFWFPGPGDGPALAKELGAPVEELERPIRYSLRGMREAPGVGRRVAATPAYLRAVTAHLRLHRPAVLHANSLYALPEATCARRLGIPVVLHVHEILGDRPKDRAILRWAGAVADRVVAVSEACAAPLRRAGRAPVTVVPNGVPAAEPGLAPAPGGPVIGTVGVVSPRKGTDVFLAMAQHVARYRPDARFVVLGPDAEGRDAPYAAEVHARVRRMAGNPPIEVRPSADVLGEMRGWTAFAMPARQDPFPLAVLEAMSLGLPVAATAVGGIPEQIEDGRSGLLVPPEDPGALARAVLALIADAEVRDRLGAGAVARIGDRFNLDRQGAALARVYDGVTGSRAARALGRAS